MYDKIHYNIKNKKLKKKNSQEYAGWISEDEK